MHSAEIARKNGEVDVSVEVLSPDATGALFDSALDLRNAITAERDRDFGPISAAAFRGRLRGTETFEQLTLLATNDGVAVGIAAIDIHHMETNADKAEVELEVHPDYRRLGVGTKLLEAAVEVVNKGGRTTLGAYNIFCEASTGFWAAFGADLKTLERESRMWLADTDASLMERWVEDRMLRASDYSLEHYKGECPKHLMSALIHLNNVMNDAPRGDADWEDDNWTASDVVDLERLFAGRGRERWVTIAFGPNGEPAGQTAISVQLDKPKIGYQGNTSVDSNHRNKGLGRWLKADMWLRVREEAPEVEAIDTDNAASNQAMLSINVAMGFEPLSEWGYYQAEVAVIRQHIEAR